MAIFALITLSLRLKFIKFFSELDLQYYKRTGSNQQAYENEYFENYYENALISIYESQFSGNFIDPKNYHRIARDKAFKRVNEELRFRKNMLVARDFGLIIGFFLST